jgi:hypothetical protein
MAYSSLMGTTRAPAIPSGRDTGSLGPSDSSDSGSDLAGIEAFEDGDPAVPLDVALGADSRGTPTPADSVAADSDAAGTGERRSAGADAGRDGGDIGLDRIVGDPDENLAGDVPPDLDALLAQPGPDGGEHEDDNDEEDDEDHETPRKEEHPVGGRRR